MVEFPHPDQVWGGEFSADGNRVLTRCEDKTVRVWDAHTAKLLAQFKHDRHVRHAYFSPDGRNVLTVAGTVRVWDSQSATLLTDSIRHSNDVSAARFSPDGTKIVTTSGDKTARVWDARSGQPLGPALVHESDVEDVRFSPDGKLIATAAFDTSARIWEAATGGLIKELTFEASSRGAIFSPDGQTLATTYGASLESPLGALCLWHWRDGKLLTEPIRHPGVVWSATFSPSGNSIATVCQDGKARLWDVRTGRQLMEPVLANTGTAGVFSPDEKQLLTVNGVGEVAMWPLPPHDPPVPGWLPRLAEAIAGQRLNEQGGRDAVPRERLREMREEISRLPGKDGYTRYAKWIFADRADRTIAPDSTMARAEYIQQAVEEEDFDRAIRLSPTNGIVFARLGRSVAAGNACQDDVSKLDPHFQRQALWCAMQATNLAPGSAEAWWTLADLLDQIGKTEAARSAVERALALAPNDPNAWLIKAFVLTSAGESGPAAGAYAKGKGLAAASKNPETEAWTKQLLTAANLVNRLHNYNEAAAANIQRRHIPARPPQAKPNLIDLSAFYNASLTEDWVDAGRNLAGLPEGVHTIDGVDFDLRGMVRLNTQSIEGEVYPKQIIGMPAGLAARQLHFLHAADLSTSQPREGMSIGRYIVHLADGQQQEIPLPLGPNYTHWRDQTGGFEERVVPAWKVRTRETGRYVRLFKGTWNNPSPLVAIQSIDFISSRGEQAPFLVAVTAQTETPPVITTQPQTVTALLGGPARFTLEVKNSSPVEYQWRFNEKELYGETNATLAFANVVRRDLGSYSVVVRNAAADSVVSVTSQAAGLLVKEGGIIHGALRREVFKSIRGRTLADLTNHVRFPDHPDVVDLVYTAETPNNVDDDYGVRLSGFVIPPANGDYTFYVCSDDQGALFLSTDDAPARKVQIAAEPAWNSPRDWVTTSRRPNKENISKPIPLQVGRRYYIELPMKEEKQGDSLGVTWQLPGEPPPEFGDPPIPGTYLAHPVQR